ncbi:hypothetical protein [Neorhizobium galegae]|uniref:hypothetical protein n=1 Tax=Neorhizobium galegae TaxID=399 RepID=UPI00062280E9|nr:hypothetical protein [Neorhizobium galegae]CDZ55034.1 Hypothetical protein NGAL_HAMBI2427_59530 [Neorhizobium galegae bv. orientalis]
MFDRIKFIEDAKLDPDAIIGMGTAANIDVPPRDTLRKWFVRGSIPGEWWPIILALLELEKGHPVSLLPYIVAGRNDDVFA